MASPASCKSFPVRCGGSTHRILFDGKRVFFPDHRRGDLNFLLALRESGHRCAEILDTLRTHKRLFCLPKGLRAGLETYWTTRWKAQHGHHPSPMPIVWPRLRGELRAQAVTRRFRPILQSCATRGLRVHFRCPVVTPPTRTRAVTTCSLRPGTDSHAARWTQNYILATRRNGTWDLSAPGITDAIRNVGVAAMGLWMSEDQRRCVPCTLASTDPDQHYLPPPASGLGSLLAHARSGRHWSILHNILTAALEETSQ